MGNASRCYYTDPIAAIQNNYKELGIEVDCQKQVEAIKNESKLSEGVKNNVNESAEIGLRISLQVVDEEEEKTAAELNMNPTENKHLKTKNNEESINIGNIYEIYSNRYCYQDGFGIEEDKHKVFEYYKKLTDASRVNRAFMVGTCYYDNAESNRLYILESFSQNGASTIKNKRMGFDLDPIENKCSETKDHDGLEDNYQQNLNSDTCPNSAKSVPKNKVYNNCVLVKMEVKNSIETNRRIAYHNAESKK
ncbi:hypothetical protein F8M41_015477 [Gigaspora margarita]|uniref:Uncharacterized protein n=1 Tax=Gigaspora margarita TaxID=4874 RepID=A0A8H4AQL1_GIGMA|nr:hypothetical protein F8M41_015477 [Gigaspora margarita]